MNWKLINKNTRIQPVKGTYNDWKEQIAEDCYHQCVYCAIHESQFGGIDHYHIDHFKPKKPFHELENIIYNLYYACPICNKFKSNDWPNEPDLDKVSYPDPSEINYSELFEIKDDFEIEGKFISSKYIVHRLFLNRAQLIFERREIRRRNQEIELRDSINLLLKQIDKYESNFAIEILKEVTAVYNELLTLEQKKRKIRPYKLSDIRKP